MPGAEHLSDEVKRRFYKNYYKSKKKAFTKYAKKYAEGGKAIEAELEALKAHSTVVRVLAHTQIRKISNWGQKKAHVLEVQARPPTSDPGSGLIPCSLLVLCRCHCISGMCTLEGARLLGQRCMSNHGPVTHNLLIALACRR